MAVKKETLTDKAFTGAIFLTIGNIFNFTIRLGVLAIMARLIKPESFGIVGLAIIIVEFLKVISEMGFGAAMIQRKNLTPAHIGTGLWVSLFLSIFITFSLISYSDLLGQVFNMGNLPEAITILASLIVFNSISQTSECILRKKMHFGYISIIHLISFTVGFGIIGLTAAFYDLGIKALIYAHLSSGIVKFLFFIPFIYKSLGFFPKWLKFKELFKFSGWYTWTRILGFAGQQSEKVIIGRYMGSEALGIYGRSQNIVNLPLEFLSGMLGNILFPSFSLISSEKEKLTLSFKIAYGITSLITIPLSLIILLFAEELILVLLGVNWTQAILPLQIFSFILFLRTMSRITQELIKSLGRERERSVSQLIFVLLIIPGSLFFANHGINAIAGVVSFAYFINFLVMLLLAKWYAGIKIVDLLKSISESFLMCLLILLAFLFLQFLSIQFNIDIAFVKLLIFGLILAAFILIMYFLKPKWLLGKSGVWMEEYLIKRYMPNKK